MPHTRSAKKNLRKNLKRRMHNRAVIRRIKEQIKKFTATVEKGPSEQVQKEFRFAVKLLDKAAARRVVHPNLAARKKAQLARRLNAKQAATKPSARG